MGDNDVSMSIPWQQQMNPCSARYSLQGRLYMYVYVAVWELLVLFAYFAVNLETALKSNVWFKKLMSPWKLYQKKRKTWGNVCKWMTSLIDFKIEDHLQVKKKKKISQRKMDKKYMSVLFTTTKNFKNVISFTLWVK